MKTPLLNSYPVFQQEAGGSSGTDLNAHAPAPRHRSELRYMPSGKAMVYFPKYLMRRKRHDAQFKPTLRISIFQAEGEFFIQSRLTNRPTEAKAGIHLRAPRLLKATKQKYSDHPFGSFHSSQM